MLGGNFTNSHGGAKHERTCSKECQDFIHLPEEEQKNLRSGIDKGRNVFNKSKQLINRKFQK